MIAALLVLLAQSGAPGIPPTPVEPEAGSDSYSPPPSVSPNPLRVTGYIDIGFARAQGDGTSFPAGDLRTPADYGVDAFASAVNSRGDVASTDSHGRFTNGFLPRSAGIGGNASFLINTVDLDVRYMPATAPLLLFVRVQFVPRFGAASETRLVVEQAFGRLTPLANHELALFLGKFDSVFGIEYLENEANLRTGITPSLLARYTTGQSIGAKLFYRRQIPALWTAVSANVAATNQGTLVETLQPAEASLTGVPVLSGRLGIEINLPFIEVKAGASGMYGPRNDQRESGVKQRAWGFDARIVLGGLSLSAEWVDVDQEPGGFDKANGLGPQTIASGFTAHGGYVQAAYSLSLGDGVLQKLTAYGRYGRRHAQFEAFTPINVDRITAGLRLDLWDALLVKGELLVNRQLADTPKVPNNVLTSSVVYSW